QEVLLRAAHRGERLGADEHQRRRPGRRTLRLPQRLRRVRSPGAPMQAVLGTTAVFAGVLVAYKTRLIRVDRRFYRFVAGAAIGFLLLIIANLLFAAFGGGLCFRTGGLGIVFGIIGVVLGACFLALDFKQVEDGVKYGAPREESWLAAFGLTLSLVWIYTELLRLITISNQAQ
ncbi:hypothetical protein CK936_29990, partial [Streptomyces albireticuli]